MSAHWQTIQAHLQHYRQIDFCRLAFLAIRRPRCAVLQHTLPRLVRPDEEWATWKSIWVSNINEISSHSLVYVEPYLICGCSMNYSLFAGTSLLFLVNIIDGRSDNSWPIVCARCVIRVRTWFISNSFIAFRLHQQTALTSCRRDGLNIFRHYTACVGHSRGNDTFAIWPEWLWSGFPARHCFLL